MLFGITITLLLRRLSAAAAATTCTTTNAALLCEAALPLFPPLVYRAEPTGLCIAMAYQIWERHTRKKIMLNKFVLDFRQIAAMRKTKHRKAVDIRVQMFDF